MRSPHASEPTLSPDLVKQVLERLGLEAPPARDLGGLTQLSARYCASVPFDNIRKRIWFAGARVGPLPGAEPADFFETWLAHGVGATCWPSNGALHSLLRSLGFAARRGAGSMMIHEEEDTNHGTVIVTLDGVDYLVDGNIGTFEPLPLVRGEPTSAGRGIHTVRAEPLEDRFEVLWYRGHSREQPLPFRTHPQHEGADHAFFLSRYERTKRISPFNESLYVSRRFADSIVTLLLGRKSVLRADGSMVVTEVDEPDLKRALVEELGVSEEMASWLPPDVARGATFT